MPFSSLDQMQIRILSYKNILFFEANIGREDANLPKRFLSAKVLVVSGKVHERNIIVKNTDYTDGILSRKSSRKWSFFNAIKRYFFSPLTKKREIFHKNLIVMHNGHLQTIISVLQKQSD